MRSGRRRRGAAWDGRHLAEVDDDSAVVDEAVVHFKIAEARKDDWREERPGIHAMQRGERASATRLCCRPTAQTAREQWDRNWGGVGLGLRRRALHARVELQRGA
jgi:hypothetical protein